MEKGKSYRWGILNSESTQGGGHLVVEYSLHSDHAKCVLIAKLSQYVFVLLLIVQMSCLLCIGLGQGLTDGSRKWGGGGEDMEKPGAGGGGLQG
jgi:hypothetical protein